MNLLTDTKEIIVSLILEYCAERGIYFIDINPSSSFIAKNILTHETVELSKLFNEGYKVKHQSMIYDESLRNGSYVVLLTLEKNID